MNPLENHANLFINGKFSARLIGHIKPIAGCRTRHSNYELQLGYPQEGMSWYGANRSQLVARPVAGMADKEMKELYRMYNEPYQENCREIITDHISNNKWLPSDAFLYLLSIGVYPFDQQHFENGTVLNINDIHRNSTATSET